MALANYGNGIIDQFNVEIMKPDPDYEIIRNIPKVMEKIGSQMSVNFLFELLDFGDSAVRSESLRSLNQLKIQFPHLIFSNKQIVNTILDEAKLYLDTLSALYILQTRIDKIKEISNKNSVDEVYEARKSLIVLLEHRLDDNLERIFRLLGLKYPPGEIDTVYRNLKSDKPDLRVNAIEFLDNLLEEA